MNRAVTLLSDILAPLATGNGAVRSFFTDLVLSLPSESFDDIGLARYAEALAGDEKASQSFAKWAVSRLPQPEFDTSDVALDRDALGIDLAVYCLATSDTLEQATTRFVQNSNGSISNLETMVFMVGLASRMLLKLARSVPDDCFRAAEGKVASAKVYDFSKDRLSQEFAESREEAKQLREENAKLREELDQLKGLAWLGSRKDARHLITAAQEERDRAMIEAEEAKIEAKKAKEEAEELRSEVYRLANSQMIQDNDLSTENARLSSEAANLRSDNAKFHEQISWLQTMNRELIEQRDAHAVRAEKADQELIRVSGDASRLVKNLFEEKSEYNRLLEQYNEARKESEDLAKQLLTKDVLTKDVDSLLSLKKDEKAERE